MGGDYVDQEGALIEVEVWDYHWVNAPSALTWISSPGSVPWCAPALLSRQPSQTLSQPWGRYAKIPENHTEVNAS